MKTNHILTISLLTVALQFMPAIRASIEASETKNDIELQQGYRRERFDVKAKGGSKTELHSKHIDVYSSRLLYNAKQDGCFFQAQAGYGRVVRGQAVLFERLKGHHHHEIFQTNFHASGDYTTDLAAFIGKEYQLSFGWLFAPKIGYSFARQKFHFNHAVATLRTNSHTGRHIHHHKREHGVTSSYHANWYSPQIGLKAQKELSQNFALFADYSFLWPLRYRAVGHWHTPGHGSHHYSDSATQRRSFGHQGIVGAKFRFNPSWSLNLEYELSKFYGKGGHQRWDHKEKVSLHKADRSTSEIRLALCYEF